VQILEARLGAALFERRANRLVPTPAGRRYHIGLTPLLDALAQLTAQVAVDAQARIVTVGVGPTFAIRWLIPRLAEFRKVAPDIEVRITTGGSAAPFADDWTCGVSLGNGGFPGLEAERLFAPDLAPVCTPSLAARLRRPADLDSRQLLRVAHAREDWPTWLAAAGVSRLAARGPEFEFYGHALQAAADGLGIAMGIRPYIDDDLAAGRLVMPFALTVPKGKEWYLVYRAERRAERDFVAFRDWMVRAARRADAPRPRPAAARRNPSP
jgi:LysR family glycine cleavage system transcriptional activator